MEIRQWKNAIQSILIVASITAGIIATLWVATYIQLQIHDPLDHPSLKTLSQQINENPNNQEMKEQFRALDFFLRKAFFTTQAQLRYASYVFGFCILMIIICTKVLRMEKLNLPNMPNPGENFPEKNPNVPKKVLLSLCIGVFGITIWCAYFLEQEYIQPIQEKRTTPPVKIISLEPKNIPTQPISPTTKNIETERTDVSPIKENEHTNVATQANQEIPPPITYTQQFPCFRGPFGHGIINCVIPTQWDGVENKNIHFKIKIPKPGFNSPIIWGNMIFASGADHASREIYAWNKNTGELRWQYNVTNVPNSPAKLPKVTADTGYSAPTLATDGIAVYAIFANGDLVAVDFYGKLVWAKNLGLPKNHYGHSSSLYTYQDTLLVQYDHDTETKLLAFDCKTGSEMWNTPRDVQISWASPMIIPGETPKIVLSATPKITCYDIRNGELLWESECIGGEVAPSPAYSNGRIFVTNVGAGLTALSEKDGSILWELLEGEFPEVSSPVAYQDYLFVANSYGGLFCFSAENGTILWQTEFKQGFYASPILSIHSDDKAFVYITDKKGTTHIFLASKEYQPIAECRLGEDVVSTFACTPHQLYIRGIEHLYCIQEK